jgi:hypothetical protein
MERPVTLGMDSVSWRLLSPFCFNQRRWSDSWAMFWQWW